MTLKETVILVAIVALLIFGLMLGPAEANEPKVLDRGATPEEALEIFVNEICNMKGMISVTIEGTKYICEEYKDEKTI